MSDTNNSCNANKIQKWTCDYCTYENFPSSIKCTMCKGAKPLLNEDIFRLSPQQSNVLIDGDCEARGAVSTLEELSSSLSSTDQQTTNMQNVAGVTSNDNKWACKMCTYLNWPRSQRCVQCYTKKGAILEIGSNETTIIASRQQNFDRKTLITNNESLKQQEILSNNVNNKKSLMKLSANIPTTSNNIIKNTDNIQGTTISATKYIALPSSVSSSSNLEKTSNIYVNKTILNEETSLAQKQATTTKTATADRTERSERTDKDFTNNYKKQSKQLSEVIDETHISSSMIIASTTRGSIAPTAANSNLNAKIQMTEQTTNNSNNNNLNMNINNMNMNNSNNYSNFSNNNNHNHCISSSSSSLSRCNSSNMDAEMNASNSAASAAAAAVMVNAERLSPLGAATAHMNLTVASMKQQQTNQQQLQQQQQQQQQQHYSNNQNQSNMSNNQQNYHLSYMISKWSCNACTYENYPKSLKCSMCGTPKTGGSGSSCIDTNIIHASTSSGTSGHVAGNVSNTSCSGSNVKTNNNNNNIHNIIYNNNTSNNLKHKGNNGDKVNDTVSSNNSLNKQQQLKNIYQLGSSSDTINNCDTAVQERQDRQDRRQRQLRRQVDWQWLNACLGVVENNYSAVEAYLSCGGNPARSLTATEIALLNRNSAFDVGHTLIHLAIRFHREEMLPMLLAQISGSGPGIKRVPSFVAPDLATDIRRHFANMLRVRKSVFNCHYVQEHATFSLPADIEELPLPIQEQLYDELLDRDAQKQLENPPPALNWSLEITARLGSRLLVLWNRSAGDCLLDSAMQATWGVFDRDNTLRRALADSLHQCSAAFFTRWKEYEMLQASMLHFTLEEAQWQEDWSNLLLLASQPGSSLEQLHIFALAHILRRPIIVYGVKYVKSFRGEDIGYARFEGLYLPLFWEQSFCIKSPIALGYTRGHFSALVPMEPYARIDLRRDESEDVTYLPLMDCESKLLPIHFLAQNEMGHEESIMRQWLDVCVTDGGLLVAQQKLRKRPLLVAQMLEEWLNHYRSIAQVITAPYIRRPQQTGYSSEGDSDEE